MEKLPAKEVRCNCGHTFNIDRKRYWCEKCANPVYYDEKDKNSHKYNTLVVYGVFVAVITFLTYVFIELIVKNVMPQ